MARGNKPEDSSDESGTDSGVERVDPAAVATAAAADSGNVAGESRTDRAKRAWETRRANLKGGKAVSVATKPASAQASVALNVNSVQFALTGIHALLAAGLHAPELELSEVEAKTVSENLVAVARHYDLQATAKATDWSNFAISLGIVYGGRVTRIMARKNVEARAKRARNAGLGAVAADIQSAAAPPAMPRTETIQHPVAAGKPNGASPIHRARTREDDIMLNEIEPAMFAS